MYFFSISVGRNLTGKIHFNFENKDKQGKTLKNIIQIIFPYTYAYIYKKNKTLTSIHIAFKVTRKSKTNSVIFYMV